MVDFKYWFDITKKLLLFMLSIFLIYIGFKISIFYIPFLIAFVLSLLIEPLIRFCMRKLKMRRKVSAILIFLIILSIIIRLNNLGNSNTCFRSIKLFREFKL